MRRGQDGVGQGNVVGETTTPVVDQEVILFSGQRLPDVGLPRGLLVQHDVLRDLLLELGVQQL